MGCSRLISNVFGEIIIYDTQFELIHSVLYLVAYGKPSEAALLKKCLVGRLMSDTHKRLIEKKIISSLNKSLQTTPANQQKVKKIDLLCAFSSPNLITFELYC